MRSTSRRIRLAVGLAASFLVAGSSSAAARIGIDDVRGHLALGYGHLFTQGAPGGSISIAGGLDLPLTSSLRYGVDVGYDLLGTRTEERGSLIGELDYGVFEVLGLLHWTPPWAGPLGRVSIGPGAFNARADLASSGGHAFTDLAVDQMVLGGAVGITLMSRKPSPVRVGLELGARYLHVDRVPDWTVASGRIVFHY